jgi:hypothetical protein
MTFTTLAIVGLLAAAGGAAVYNATGDRKSGAGGRTVGSVSQAQGNAAGRPIPPGATITGEAMLRSDWEKQQTTPDAPPSTSELASANTVSAYAAGERARKRAAAGGSVLTGAQKGMPGPGGSYAPKTLLGS